MLTDADLLDLLEILEAVISRRDVDQTIKMLQSFRTAVRQRMISTQGEV